MIITISKCGNYQANIKINNKRIRLKICLAVLKDYYKNNNEYKFIFEVKNNVINRIREIEKQVIKKFIKCFGLSKNILQYYKSIINNSELIINVPIKNGSVTVPLTNDINDEVILWIDCEYVKYIDDKFYINWETYDMKNRNKHKLDRKQVLEEEVIYSDID